MQWQFIHSDRRTDGVFGDRNGRCGGAIIAACQCSLLLAVFSQWKRKQGHQLSEEGGCVRRWGANVRPSLPEHRENECTTETKKNCQLKRNKQEQTPSKDSQNGLINEHSSWKQGRSYRCTNTLQSLGPLRGSPLWWEQLLHLNRTAVLFSLFLVASPTSDYWLLGSISHLSVTRRSKWPASLTTLKECSFSQGSQTTQKGQFWPSSSFFVNIKYYLHYTSNTATPILLHIVCGCSCTTRPELSPRDPMTPKSKIYTLCFFKKIKNKKGCLSLI